MTFIEQLVGVSPDGGTGSFEALLFILPLMAALILAQRRGLGQRR